MKYIAKLPLMEGRRQFEVQRNTKLKETFGNRQWFNVKGEMTYKKIII
jgi:hypothetical protein